ncbi:MAG: HepT-like ribonuclease domain-containing protein [Chloroflexota bacterium]
MNEQDYNRLIDMRQAALRAIKFADGKSRDDLHKENELLGFAIVRAIEVVGEAASKIDLDVRKEHARIEWRNMIGMRNRIVHDYGNVDYDIVWQVVTVNLPKLVEQLDELLQEDNDEQ